MNTVYILQAKRKEVGQILDNFDTFLGVEMKSATKREISRNLL